MSESPAPVRYNNLQMLRFWAALGVVLFHASHYLQAQAGVVDDILLFLSDPRMSRGVLLFFVLSGFVLSHNLRSTAVSKFLIFRFLRIYPAFYLATVLSVSTKLALFRSYPWSDLGVSLTLLPLGPRGYPLGVEWTLIYEVFFYLVLAILSIPRSKVVLNAFLLIWIGAILSAALFYPGGATRLLPTIKSIFFSGYDLPFITGIIVYQVFERFRQHSSTLLALSILSFLAAELVGNSLLQLVALSVSFGALVGWAALKAIQHDAHPKSFWVRLGDYSYGLYLVHVPVVTIFYAVTISLTRGNPSLFFALAVALALFVGLLFGAVEMSLYRRLKALVDGRLQSAGWAMRKAHAA